MRIRSLALILFGLLVVGVGSTRAQGPKLPYKDVGACPFECCTYRGWVANKDTIIYKEKRDGSPVAFRVKKRERVTGVTGVVITTKAGIVKVLRNTTINEEGTFHVRAGDTIYLLTYKGEGFYTIWYKGRYSVGAFYDDSNLRTVSDPDSVWWVKIRNRRGQVGWTRLPENFDNKDSCG